MHIMALGAACYFLNDWPTCGPGLIIIFNKAASVKKVQQAETVASSSSSNLAPETSNISNLDKSSSVSSTSSFKSVDVTHLFF